MGAETFDVPGGPFDIGVIRNGKTISLRVIGKHGDIITQIDFNAERIDNVICALVEARG